MKFINFLKNVFISKFWIKAICLLMSLFVVLAMNIR